ncbi:AAA family ATPase [Alkalibaculum sp. M08DMB]|uniref:AAA family ATPase n=1 Tax=Alkalibaculum sporogenes TaxID=2655001 RepID=A0A6A7K608_9FIRM|nr:AAA family ATPase [Alkalibaculum sporogenes]MPW24878.1 AAA family ATPase [Alkalibaculum sporogenes]
MYIKKLIISSFGKYENEQIEFKEGINIVYGENESGKSTIHKFIEAMLFGFFKDQKARRAYSDDYNKYLPLHTNKYGGILIFNDQGKEIRIERNLLKGKDKVIIYDNNTGEDISNKYYYDVSTKLYAPFDDSVMNRRIYKNTISISQLGCGTSSDLIEELKDKLINLNDSKSDLSVRTAISSLSDSLYALGTEKRKNNSPMYEMQTSLEKLQKDRNMIIENMDKVSTMVSEINILDSNIEKNTMIKEKYSNDIKALKYQKERIRLEEYNRKLDENNNLLKEMREIKCFNVSEKDYKHLKKNMDEINMLQKQVVSGIEKKEKCKNEISKIERTLPRGHSLYKNRDFKLDYNEMQNLNNEKNILVYKRQNSNQVLLEDKLKKDREDFQKYCIIFVLSLLSSISSIILGLIHDPLLYVFLLFLPIAYLNYKKFNHRKKEISIVKKQLLEMQNTYEELKLRLETVEININNIIKKYDCKSYEEFIGEYYQNAKDTSALDKVKEELIILRERNKNIDDSIEFLEEEIRKLKDENYSLLEKNNVNTLEEFEENINNILRRDQLKLKSENNKIVLKNIIPIEELQKVISNVEIHTSTEERTVYDDLDNLMKYETSANEKIKSMEIEKSKLEGQIETLISQNASLPDVENEIIFIENEILKLRSKEKSLQLAISTIQNISEEIHNELAPELNKLLGEIISKITGKYQVLKVAKDLDIKVEHPIDNQLIDLNKLSSGTLDQVYFAFRMGLNQFLNKSEFPILLDESFIQYDDNRLANTLKYLTDNNKKRQILIFTSQDREVRITEKYTLQYNLIKLH